MPLRKPKTGESQSEWMGYCMAELKDSETERDQEQMVAICLNAWREGKKLKAEDDDGSKPYGDVEYADPGYQEDGVKRYPIDTEKHIRAAWNYIAHKDNQEPYTFDQVKKIKQRIVAAWRKKIDEDGPPGLEDDEHLGKKLKQDYGGYDAPDVEEGETHAEYIERCTSDLTEEGASEEEANSLCALAWENRSAAHRLRHKTHSELVQGRTFTLSDETPDRMGDIVSANGWDLTNFRRNPIALWNHLSSHPIGVWENLRVEETSLRGDLRLAPKGTSERIDEIRKLVEAGILKAVSVGFRPITSQPRKMGEKHIGEHFLKQELVETSLVSVPANPNALAIAKSLDISSDTLELVFAEHGIPNRRKHISGSSRGEHAVTIRRSRQEDPMSLGQRIQETQQRINMLRDKLTDHLADVDDSNVSDSQLQVTQDLNEQIQREQKQLAALSEAEKNMMGSTALVKIGDETVRTKNGGGSGASYIYTKQPMKIPNTREARLDIVVRAGVVSALAHVRKVSIEVSRDNIAREYARYGDDSTKAFCDYISKAPTAPAMTTVAGWAEELVQQIHADYMELLYPKSVLPRLSPRGLSLSFGRAGRISIPTRSRTPSISGSFVGEGMPIPVRQAAFSAQILTPKKMAVITSWTREMDEASIPAIEGLLRSAIQEDTATTIDSCLLDTNNADAVRPAGLLSIAPLPNGSGAITVPPTAGGGFNALVGDLKGLAGALLAATQGNIRDMVFLMNPMQTLAASLTAMPGVSTFPFAEIGAGRLLGYGVIDSGTVPAGTIVALDAADFVIVGGEAPRFEVSDQATLHYEDTDPEHINDGTPAVPVRSLWQTDSLALRLVLPLNWCMRRPGMVASISAVTW